MKLRPHFYVPWLVTNDAFILRSWPWNGQWSDSRRSPGGRWRHEVLWRRPSIDVGLERRYRYRDAGFSDEDVDLLNAFGPRRGPRCASTSCGVMGNFSKTWSTGARSDATAARRTATSRRGHDGCVELRGAFNEDIGAWDTSGASPLTRTSAVGQLAAS